MWHVLTSNTPNRLYYSLIQTKFQHNAYAEHFDISNSYWLLLLFNLWKFKVYRNRKRKRKKNMDPFIQRLAGWWFIVKFLSKHCKTKREFNCIKSAHGTVFTIQEEEKQIFLWFFCCCCWVSFVTHRPNNLGTFRWGILNFCRCRRNSLFWGFCGEFCCIHIWAVALNQMIFWKITTQKPTSNRQRANNQN